MTTHFYEDDYQIVVAPAADSVTSLRAIDLDRVLMNAHDNFPASTCRFLGWLIEKRPDLKDRIDRAVDDLIAEGLWT